MEPVDAGFRFGALLYLGDTLSAIGLDGQATSIYLAILEAYRGVLLSESSIPPGVRSRWRSSRAAQQAGTPLGGNRTAYAVSALASR